MYFFRRACNRTPQIVKSQNVLIPAVPRAEAAASTAPSAQHCHADVPRLLLLLLLRLLLLQCATTLHVLRLLLLLLLLSTPSRNIRTPIKKFKLLFLWKLRFQTPGLVPSDSSRNSALCGGIHLSGTLIWTRIGQQSFWGQLLRNDFKVCRNSAGSCAAVAPL